ncbi:uncharacterized protein TNCV_3881731 [Trichonephila clavipes]|nr:uncharacterized protein TNCV_3881731 [Trichonephila clavipes]
MLCHQQEYRANHSTKHYGYRLSEPKAHSCTLVDCKALRLAWGRQHRHWTVNDWKHVAWSDESRFQLNRADRRVWVWRQPDESMDPTCQQGTIDM